MIRRPPRSTLVPYTTLFRSSPSGRRSSWVDDHFERSIYPLGENPVGLGEFAQWVAMRDQRPNANTPIHHEWDDPAHLSRAGPHSNDLKLIEHHLLDGKLHAAQRYPDHRTPPSSAQHCDAPPQGLRCSRALEGNLHAHAGGHLTHGGDRIAAGHVNGLVANTARLRHTRPSPQDDHATGTHCPRALGHEDAHHSRTGDGKAVSGVDAAASHRVQGDGRRVEHSRLLVSALVGNLENTLDRVHDERRIAALRVVAVLAVHRIAPVVFAEVIATFDALATVAAAGVRGARHAIPNRPAKQLGTFTERNYLA